MTPPTPSTPLDAATPQVADRLLRALGSFRLTLSLFALLGLFAALGTFIPQGDDAPRIAQLYGQPAYDMALKLGLNEVYRSWWFIMVLALMALNLIMVTWVRVPHVWRLSRETDAVLLKDPLVPKTAFTQVWETPYPTLEALDRSRRVLQRQFPRLAQQEGPAKRLLVGEKHFISLWAAHIVHLGLLLCLLAGVLKILFGTNDYVIIKEGDKASVKAELLHWGFFFDKVHLPGGLSLPLPYVYERVAGKAGFEVSLDKFDVEYYPGSNAPSLFRSDVVILRDGKPERKASILVNEPLTVDNYMLYQSSFGYEGLYSAHFEVTLPGEKDRLDVRAPYQQKIDLLGTGWQLEVVDFYPDAEMAGPGKLVNASTDLHNPAIRVRFWQHGKERALTWFVYSAPDIQMTHVPGLKLVGKTVDPIAFTVLQANADPGIYFAFAGVILVVFGVFSAFYLFYRKAWVLVEPLPDGGSRVTLAGFVRRNKIGFRRVFERLSKEMEESLKPGSSDNPEDRA